ncbi:hypothetical protein LIER_40669 [Lithospermum erythrorhizon]|uniref:Uncharacterized protein n=1 Tax=Lithospermum erythrorhizon TaxID=34254 RepID=A0AAV3R116_LITER
MHGTSSVLRIQNKSWNGNIYMVDEVSSVTTVHASDIYVGTLATSPSDTWVLGTGSGTHICKNVWDLHNIRKVVRDELDLQVGNGAKVATIAA